MYFPAFRNRQSRISRKTAANVQKQDEARSSKKKEELRLSSDISETRGATVTLNTDNKLRFVFRLKSGETPNPSDLAVRIQRISIASARLLVIDPCGEGNFEEFRNLR